MDRFRYLLQEKLEYALKAIVGEAAWRGREVHVGAGRKQRWDMAYEQNGAQVAVEFDGDEHYRHTLKIKTDREKDAAATRAGHRLVRFPYWVQLTDETLGFYFGLQAKVEQDFPHGFITTRVFPASFCELGLERFRRELEELPDSVRAAVLTSLRDRARQHGAEYVVPRSLGNIL